MASTYLEDQELYDATLERVNMYEQKELEEEYGDLDEYVLLLIQEISALIYTLSTQKEVNERYIIKYNWSTVTNLVVFRLFDKKSQRFVENLHFYTDTHTKRNIERAQTITYILRNINDGSYFSHN